ncbi:MAG: hypothetical protein AAGC77_09120, partial [Pseudomonadota bacterium]
EIVDARLNDALVRIEKKIAWRLGGKIGEVWTVDPADLENGDELMEVINRLPLAASNNPNDPLGVIRQIANATNGGVLVRFVQYQANDGSEAEGTDPKILSRTEINSYWDAELNGLDDDEFSAMVLGGQSPF